MCVCIYVYMSLHVHVPRFVMPTMLLSLLLSQLRCTLLTMKGILHIGIEIYISILLMCYAIDTLQGAIENGSDNPLPYNAT